jgi:hypothetical protein
VTPRKERPIRCEGRPELAVKNGSTWLCARCGGVLLTCYVGPDRAELDGVHDSMTPAFLTRRLHTGARLPPRAT